MRDDIPEPAVRLLASLPVTEHRQREPDARKLARPKNVPTRRGAQAKPIIVNGVTYANLRDAKNRLKYGAKKIQTMLDTGMAEYV